jgi:hypothetical protein
MKTKRIALAITLLVCVLLGFEIGVRLLPPDAVRYTIQTINPDGSDTTVSGTITDPATIARWRAAMTARPNGTLIKSYQLRWQGNGCAPLTLTLATYTYTWHGLPVEVVSVGPGCGGVYQVTSGGTPDWNTYVIDPLPQPTP